MPNRRPQYSRENTNGLEKQTSPKRAVPSRRNYRDGRYLQILQITGVSYLTTFADIVRQRIKGESKVVYDAYTLEQEDAVNDEEAVQHQPSRLERNVKYILRSFVVEIEVGACSEMQQVDECARDLLRLVLRDAMEIPPLPGGAKDEYGEVDTLCRMLENSEPWMILQSVLIDGLWRVWDHRGTLLGDDFAPMIDFHYEAVVGVRSDIALLLDRWAPELE
jgi:hypothetical protein